MPEPSARSRALVALLGVCVLGAAPRIRAWADTWAAPSVAVQTAAPATPSIPTTDILNKYCVTCHNSRLKTAGLQIDSLDLQHVAGSAQQWEKIVTKLRTGEMPPPGRPRPDAATYAAVATALERELDAAAAAKPSPGRVPVHRLNRSEYTNAIRDLLDLEIDGRALLSSDEADQEGFDNVASVLSVSPALLENYLSAARTLSRLAVGDPSLHPVIDTFKISKALVQDERLNDDLPFGSQGGALIRYHFPLDAEYTIKVLLRRQEYDYIIGLGEPHQLDFRLDGVLLKRFTVGGEARGMTNPENFAGNTQGDPEFEEYMHTADANLEVRVPVKAGPHEVSVSFVRRFWEPEGVLQPPQTGFGRTTNEYYHGNPAAEIVSIGGPYGNLTTGVPRRTLSSVSSAVQDSPSRRRVFICQPPDKNLACARKILSTLAMRAYRRPVTESEIETLLGFYKAEDSFDAGIQRGIERILAAPSFLFRIEREPPGIARVLQCERLELVGRRRVAAEVEGRDRAVAGVGRVEAAAVRRDDGPAGQLGAVVCDRPDEGPFAGHVVAVDEELRRRGLVSVEEPAGRLHREPDRPARAVVPEGEDRVLGIEGGVGSLVKRPVANSWNARPSRDQSRLRRPAAQTRHHSGHASRPGQYVVGRSGGPRLAATP